MLRLLAWALRAAAVAAFAAFAFAVVFAPEGRIPGSRVLLMVLFFGVAIIWVVTERIAGPTRRSEELDDRGGPA